MERGKDEINQVDPELREWLKKLDYPSKNFSKEAITKWWCESLIKADKEINDK